MAKARSGNVLINGHMLLREYLQYLKVNFIFPIYQQIRQSPCSQRLSREIGTTGMVLCPKPQFELPPVGQRPESL